MNIAALLFKKQPQKAHTTRAGLSRAETPQAAPFGELGAFSPNYGVEVEELSLEEFYRRLRSEEQPAAPRHAY